MAIEKGKVVSKLLVKYKGTSLTKNFLENLGTRYAAKLPDDADDNAIDEYINDRDDLVQESIKETDKRVTDAVNKVKKPGDKTEEKTDETHEPPSDTPEWAKGLFGMVKTLGETVTKMQTEKTQQTLQQRFESDPRLKGINPKLLKGRVPKTEEEFETAINEAAEDLKEFVQDDNASGVNALGGKSFGKDKPNFAGKGTSQTGGGQQTPAQKTAIENVKKFTEGLNKEVKETKV